MNEARTGVEMLLTVGLPGVSALEALLHRGWFHLDESLVDLVISHSLAVTIITETGCHFAYFDSEYPRLHQALYSAAMRNPRIGALLAAQTNVVTITEEDVMTAVCAPEVMKVFLRHLEPGMPVTERILQEAFCSYSLKSAELLLQQQRILDLQQVWDGIWQNDELELEIRIGSSKILLQYGEFDVQSTVLAFLTRFREIGARVYGIDELDDGAVGAELGPLSEMNIWMLLALGCEDHIWKFLENKPHAKVTDAYLQCVEGNERVKDKDKILSFLHSKKSADPDAEPAVVPGEL